MNTVHNARQVHCHFRANDSIVQKQKENKQYSINSEKLARICFEGPVVIEHKYADSKKDQSGNDHYGFPEGIFLAGNDSHNIARYAL